MGECPDWYPLMRAARYMHTDPWVLAEQSQLWTDWALMMESVDDSGNKVMALFRSLFGG